MRRKASVTDVIRVFERRRWTPPRFGGARPAATWERHSLGCGSRMAAPPPGGEAPTKAGFPSGAAAHPRAVAGSRKTVDGEAGVRCRCGRRRSRGPDGRHRDGHSRVARPGTQAPAILREVSATRQPPRSERSIAEGVRSNAGHGDTGLAETRGATRQAAAMRGAGKQTAEKQGATKLARGNAGRRDANRDDAGSDKVRRGNAGCRRANRGDARRDEANRGNAGWRRARAFHKGPRGRKEPRRKDPPRRRTRKGTRQGKDRTAKARPFERPGVERLQRHQECPARTHSVDFVFTLLMPRLF